MGYKIVENLYKIFPCLPKYKEMNFDWKERFIDLCKFHVEFMDYKWGPKKRKECERAAMEKVAELTKDK